MSDKSSDEGPCKDGFEKVEMSEHAPNDTETRPLRNLRRWTRFLQTTAGRDKALRFVQYFTRFLAHYAAQGGATDGLSVRAARLSAAVGMSRKRTPSYLIVLTRSLPHGQAGGLCACSV